MNNNYEMKKNILILSLLILVSCGYQRKVDKTSINKDSVSVSTLDSNWFKLKLAESKYSKTSYKETYEYPSPIITTPVINKGDTTINNYFSTTNPIRIIREYNTDDGTYVSKTLDSGNYKQKDSTVVKEEINTKKTDTKLSWPWYVYLIVVISALYLLEKIIPLFRNYRIVKK